MTSNLPLTQYTQRQRKMAAQLEAVGLYAAVFNPGPTLTYLTGMNFHLMERPVIFFLTAQTKAAIVLPVLEMAKTTRLTYDLITYPFTDDPETWGEVYKQAAKDLDLAGQKVGVEGRRLRVLELRLLERAASLAEFIQADDILSPLRLYKDQTEITAMKHAVEIAEKALQTTLPFIQTGKSERAIAGELTLQLLKHGSDAEFPFSPIVSSDPNSANPHSTPSDRLLQTGDLLVIDWGAAYNGYISDITRTFAIGGVDQEFHQIAAIVLQANIAGRNASEPGNLAQDVDRAAREIITSAGYGEFFIHRTGHGIGMEGHEDPYIREGNQLPLAPGMTFTVEPGIYLPGRGGVRIEDNVVITSKGSDCLTSLPRELRILI
jgi:Xaa-Pro dipeptidase